MSTRRSFYTVTLTLLIFTLGASAAQVAAAAPPQPSRSYSAALLYNLGNSYARNGNAGLAALNYERARLLAPDDPDLRANLGFVRSASGLPPSHANWFERVTAIASANTFFWLGCAGLCIVGASTLARRRYPRHGGVLLAASGIGLSLMILALCIAAALWPAMNEAVVVTAEAPARVAPATMAESLLTLPTAQIVSIEAESADFILVRTPAGRTGWVARADLARLIPQRG
jgi:hypothetical protein